MVEESRCPYCVLIDHFMLLSPTGDGRFVCMKCGHVWRFIASCLARMVS
jgi:transposase